MKVWPNWVTVAIASLILLGNLIGGYLVLDDLYFAEWRIRRDVVGYTVFIRTDMEAVKNEQAKDQGRIGSGFVLKYEEKFYIATNNHVANELPDANLYVQFEDEKKYHKVKRLGWDDIFDLALLEFEEEDFVPPGYVELGDSSKINTGDKVFILGNPLGLRFLTSAGKVMKPKVFSSGIRGGLIAIDATCNPGNSGGPVVAKNGKLVGVSVAITKSDHPICLAIPAETLKTLLPKLVAGGKIKHGIVGIVVADGWDMLPNEKKKAGLENFRGDGAVIVRVEPGSPADEAGIKVGDIILSFGGTADNPGIEVKDGGSFAEEFHLNFFAGDEVVLKIKRGEDYLVRKVKLVEPPSQITPLAPPEENSPPQPSPPANPNQPPPPQPNQPSPPYGDGGP